VAIRRFIWLIRISVRKFSNDWLRPESTWQRGQLELRINTNVYFPEGRFDPDRMIAVFQQLASGNAQRGFPLSLSRSSGNKFCVRSSDGIDLIKHFVLHKTFSQRR
jgi:hypothetical protein